MILKHDEVIKDLKKYFYDCEINDMTKISEIRHCTLGDIVTTHKITGRIKQYKSRGGIIYDASTKQTK